MSESLLSKFHDIQRQLTELKQASDSTSTNKASERKRSKLQSVLRNVKKRMAENCLQTVSAAEQAYEMADFESALPLFTHALEINPPTKSPADFPVMLKRAYCRLRMHQFDLALQDAEQLVNNWPRQVEAYYIRGQADMGLKRYEQSIADFETVLSMLNDSSTKSSGVIDIEFNDVRIWLQEAEASRALQRRQLLEHNATLRSQTGLGGAQQRALLTTLPRHVLVYCFGFLSHVDLTRLESVCNSWTSMLIEYRRFLWQPLYQRLRGCHDGHDGAKEEKVVDTRCCKWLFSRRYRPWTTCVFCG